MLWGHWWGTWRTQQTPKPAAQLPWATPPYWAHSVLQVVEIERWGEIRHIVMLVQQLYCMNCTLVYKKPELLSPPGVAGAVVPRVRCTLLIVKLHPGDQVEEPEISTFIFPHPAPLWTYWWRHLKFMSCKVHRIQSPGVPLPWLCKAVRGEAARQ